MNDIIAKLFVASRSLNNDRSKMPINSQLVRLFALITLGLPLSLPLAAAAQTPATIAGKQCVFNNSAFSVKVEWYEPGAIIFNGKNATESNNYSKYEVSGKPVETKNDVTVGLSSCTQGGNRVAVVRIVGHKIANNAITIAAGTLTGIVTGVAGAFACAGTTGGACPAAAVAVSTATSGVVSAVGSALPDVQEIAYIGSPGTKNYLDISGTIWNVGIANNVSLSKNRGFSAIGAWVDGGEPGAKSITFNNQSGYVAEMVVIYFQKQKIGGQIVVMPVSKSSGKVSLGFSRHIDIPVEIEQNPIQVFITGVGTTKKQIFGATIPGSFSGNKCYKSYGTIFNAKGATFGN
jgi:hypothetical protein